VPAAFPLSFSVLDSLEQRTPAGWQSGHAAACKAVDAGSIPTPASNLLSRSARVA
jgi:hypothetical protein